MSDRFPIDSGTPIPPPDKGGRPADVREIAAKYAADVAAGRYASKAEAAAAYMAEHKPEVRPHGDDEGANYRAHKSRFIELIT